MVITLRSGALLEIPFLFIDSSTPIKSIHYFVTREDDMARFDSQRYNHKFAIIIAIGLQKPYAKLELGDLLNS
jgi:hypothetical protein